jgi:hypothetical protein
MRSSRHGEAGPRQPFVSKQEAGMEFDSAGPNNTVTINSFPLGLALEESDNGYFIVNKMTRILGSLRVGHELMSLNGASLANMRLKELEKKLHELKAEGKVVTFTFRTAPEDINGPLFLPFDEATTDKNLSIDQTTAMTETNNFPSRLTTIRTSPPIPITYTHQVNANDIITPNDLKKTIINIDSRFRDNFEKQTDTNFTYRLDPQIKNIIRIKLASIEFPNIFYTFSDEQGNTRFIITYNGISAPVIIQDGNYSISDIQIAIQTKLNVATSFLGVPAPGFILTIDAFNGSVTITAPVVFSLDFTPPVTTNYNTSGLGGNLGFKNCIYSGALTYTGESIINIFGEQYVLFQLNDYNNVEQRMKDKNIIPAFAKIILKSSKFSVNYDDPSNYLTKEIIFAQPHNLSLLSVSFTDAYGTVINNDGVHISFALEITEVMNAKLYDYYRNYLLEKAIR